jgi:lipoate-protein ligase B
MPRTIHVRDLGLTDYREVHALQRELQTRRHAEGAVDTLLLTEHRPVITLGRAHPIPDLRVAPAALAAEGIEIVQAERGGDITYHGPGQLVAYGIIDLRAWELPLLDYVTGLEETVVRLLWGWRIIGERTREGRGVWVRGRKIASLGIHARKWVTMHGIALNIDPEMDHFNLINPCGMPGVEMTSLGAETGAKIPMDAVKHAFVQAFAEVFRCQVVESTPII